MAIVESSHETSARRRDDVDERERKQREVSTFLKGMVLGFGLAAVASALFNLFQDQRSARRESMTATSRFKRLDESGGVSGDLSYIIDESTGAFKDAVRTLDKTFESGKIAIDTIQDVIDKIRE